MATKKIISKNRRQSARKLAKEISALSDKEIKNWVSRTSISTIDGHILSANNICMIDSQIPHATVVGGYLQWLRAGRYVKVGQQGAAISVPFKVNEGEINERTVFKIGYVFDISQTTRDELFEKVRVIYSREK